MSLVGKTSTTIQPYNHTTYTKQIRQMGHCGKKGNQDHHATIMGAQLYVKINHNNSGPMEHKNTTQDRNHVLLWFIVTTGRTRHMNCRSQFRLLLHFHSPVTIAESHHPYTTIQ